MKTIFRWPELIKDFNRVARRSTNHRAVRHRFLAAARKALAQPLVRRVYRYKDVGKHRTWLDGRATPLREPMHTIFALAMSDHGTNNLLASELPTLAAAARLTGERRYQQRVHDQLFEMASWSPLQRPGWCAFGDRLPPDGKDGNWLATGTGVRAITDTLEILGRANLPPATVARLDQLMAAEIVSIVDDWQSKRPWFVAQNMPLTNQWVLPTEGLIRSCLALGHERHRAAYELGVANLLEHLNVHGSQGAFEEGIHYADFTVKSLLSAARAMACAGDRRAIDHAFLCNFPLWALHHFQPGGFFINAFDAFAAARGNRDMLRSTFAMAAACLASREALWALDHVAGGPDDSLAGLASSVLPRRSLRPPRTFANYARAARVNWRSSWDEQATGVWIRGGHASDSHDHMDRGHVNFILRGKPVLIEAGTPAYHNPRLRMDYASPRGHNVLQLGDLPPPAKIDYRHDQPVGWQKAQTVAPIVVRKLDTDGGDVNINGTAGYDGLKLWRRRVLWDIDQLQVVDVVRMKDDTRRSVLFRWHLGITRRPRIQTAGTCATITWPGIQLQIDADCSIKVSCEMMPDHTMRLRAWDDKRPDHLHACLIVRSSDVVAECGICLSITRPHVRAHLPHL